jgi:hypothetical protein
MIKAEIKINEERMEAKIEATQREFQTQVKEIGGGAGAERRRGTGTATGKAKPLKFDGTTGLHHGPCSGAVQDCSGTQLLDVPGEIHVLDHHLAGPGH